VVTGLQDHLERQPVDGLPAWRGELRASGPSTVIMGVTSNRVDVKMAAAAAERAVERRAEPLSAVLLPPDQYPSRLLDLAWRRMLDNAAHDSACACSTDEVVDQVLVRYAEAREIGDGLAAEAVAALARRVDAPPGSLLVVNPSPHRRAGTVQVAVPGRGPVRVEDPDGRPLPSQVLGTSQPVELTSTTPGGDVDVVLDLFGRTTFAGHRVARWHARPAAAELVLEMAAPLEEACDVAPAREWLADQAARHPEAPVHAVLLQPPVRDVLCLTPPVAGLGWTTLTVADDDPTVTAVRGGDGWIANELVGVEVDGDTGTFAVSTSDGLRVLGLNRYVDGGDAGDTYNWSPPVDDELVDHPIAVHTELVRRGRCGPGSVSTACTPGR
jgi:alpha-mannosidase